MLKTIAGLLKPKIGKIHFLEEDITALKPHQVVKKGIALVPEGRAILAKMTVLENLEMGAYHRRDNQVKKDMEKEFDRFPWMRDRKNQAGRLPFRRGTADAGHFPGPAGQPKLLLLDEPSLGLAPLVVADIFRTIKRINKAGTTVLLVEQNVKQAMKVSHFAYVLETGKIVLKGPSKDLMEEAKIKEAFLGQKG